MVVKLSSNVSSSVSEHSHGSLPALVLRRSVTVVAALTVMALSGCSTQPVQGGGSDSSVLSASDPVIEFMERAKAIEVAEGGRERARLIYREAAQAHPTDKRPWLRLAQSYFDSADYGNAVLAAQEVIQRDPSDSVAQGLLAVSGLRISTSALSVLRTQDALPSPAKTEAQDMARNLRNILKEPVLVPVPTAAETEARSKAQIRSAPRPRVTPPKPKPSTTAPVVPAAPVPAPSGNPFGAFK